MRKTRKERGGRPQRVSRIYQERHPDAAFKFVSNFLNNRNLEFLLKLCSALSCYDDFTPFTEEWALKQWINYIHNRTFLFAILESKASSVKTSLLSKDDFVKALNNVRDASYDPDALDPVMTLNGKPGVEIELHRFFGKMGNIQIAHKEHNPATSAGRLIAMLEVLPITKREWLSESMAQIADKLAPHIITILGSSVLNLARTHTVILFLCRDNFLMMLKILPHIESNITSEERLHAFIDLALSLAVTRQPFIFSTRYFETKTAGLITEGQAQNLMKIFARKMSQQRELASTQPFRHGHIASRLSPFDRFPVVSLDDESGYIVPDSTIFGKSFSFVIDYTLFEAFKTIGLQNEYSAFRGALQEVYLRALIEDRLPSYLVIPERQYGKEHRRGPDLTIINRTTKKLLIIESKSRRMRADTTALMSDEALTDNLEDVFSALEKASKKIDELYSGLTEYADAQDVVNETKDHPPLCVVVLSNAVFGLSELVRLQSKENPEHRLHNFPYPYCILSLDTFEKAVEIAHATGPSLDELLEEHWVRSEKIDFSSPAADMLGGRPLPETKERFASKFL